MSRWRLGSFQKQKWSSSKENKERFPKNFRENDLNIVIKCNLKIVDYLDVTLNLLNNTYKPFFKPNNEINYIHKESNHPPSKIKQVPFSIKSRLSSLSSSEKILPRSTKKIWIWLQIKIPKKYLNNNEKEK